MKDYFSGLYEIEVVLCMDSAYTGRSTPVTAIDGLT